jgi:hypothetical protein
LIVGEFDNDAQAMQVAQTIADLESDQAAWREALRLVRDIEDVLLPGGNWHLGVRKGEAAIYRIDISTKWLQDAVAP